MKRIIWRVVLLLSLLAAPVAAEITVRITSPPPGQAIFDQVELSVTVAGSEPIERVEFRLDGERVGTVSEPPYRLSIDVGSDNRDRLIEAVAHGRSGSIGRAKLLAPRLVVHDRLAIDLQQLYVTVTDRDGGRVLDLDRGEFRVLDQGRPQEIVTFARGDIPFTAVILVDGSGSMRGRRLQASLIGAHRFVAGMRPLDEAKVMVFSDRLLGLTPWSGSSQPLEQALHAVEAEGGTAIFDHLYLALTLLESRQGRRVVILLSDGWDAQSVLTAKQLRRVARRSQALIYWVRLAGDEPGPGRLLGDQQRHPLVPVRTLPITSWSDENTVRRLYMVLEKTVRESGGRIVSVGSAGSIESAFGDLLAELRQQYALGYDPVPRRNDGSWRQVKVELGVRGLGVRVRDGYVDR